MNQKGLTKKDCQYIVQMIVAMLMTISILGLMKISLTQISIFSGLLFVSSWIILSFFIKHVDKNIFLISGFGTMIGTFSVIAGNIIRDMDSKGLGRNIGLMDCVYAVGIAMFLFCLIHNSILVLQKCKIRESVQIQTNKKHWLILSLAFIICWLPYFTTFFPGIFGSDPFTSIRQALGDIPWTNHHPILYTAYIKLFLDVCRSFLGIEGALGCMIFCQQMILAFVLSYMVCFLAKRGVAKSVLIFSILFIAINPVIGVFSVYATKDVLFSAAMILFILQLYELVEIENRQEAPEHTFFMLLGSKAALVIFLRNNGSFIVVVSMAVACFIIKKYRKQLAIILLTMIILLVGQKTILLPALQVKEGSFAESLSIPLQQIAQTVVDGGQITEEQQRFLEKMLPFEDMKEAYEAGYTDPVKFHEHFDDQFLNDNKMTFIKIWAGMLPANFNSYVKAYLLQTAGYWDIPQTESLTMYGVIDNEYGVEQIDMIKNLTGCSLQPYIEKLILVCRKFPILCYLTNMAMMLFMVLFTISILFIKKQRKYSIAFLPLLISWGTIMIAAPASCKFRYLLAFFLAWPFTIWMLTRQMHEEELI